MKRSRLVSILALAGVALLLVGSVGPAEAFKSRMRLKNVNVGDEFYWTKDGVQLGDKKTFTQHYDYYIQAVPYEATDWSFLRKNLPSTQHSAVATETFGGQLQMVPISSRQGQMPIKLPGIKALGGSSALYMGVNLTIYQAQNPNPSVDVGTLISVVDGYADGYEGLFVSATALTWDPYSEMGYVGTGFTGTVECTGLMILEEEPIPEPSSLFAMCGLLGSAGALMRRRR